MADGIRLALVARVNVNFRQDNSWSYKEGLSWGSWTFGKNTVNVTLLTLGRERPRIYLNFIGKDVCLRNGNMMKTDVLEAKKQQISGMKNGNITNNGNETTNKKDLERVIELGKKLRTNKKLTAEESEELEGLEEKILAPYQPPTRKELITSFRKQLGVSDVVISDFFEKAVRAFARKGRSAVARLDLEDFKKFFQDYAKKQSHETTSEETNCFNEESNKEKFYTLLKIFAQIDAFPIEGEVRKEIWGPDVQPFPRDHIAATRIQSVWRSHRVKKTFAYAYKAIKNADAAAKDVDAAAKDAEAAAKDAEAAANKAAYIANDIASKIIVSEVTETVETADVSNAVEAVKIAESAAASAASAVVKAVNIAESTAASAVVEDAKNAAIKAFIATVAKANKAIKIAEAAKDAESDKANKAENIVKAIEKVGNDADKVFIGNTEVATALKNVTKAIKVAAGAAGAAKASATAEAVKAKEIAKPAEVAKAISDVKAINAKAKKIAADEARKVADGAAKAADEARKVADALFFLPKATWETKVNPTPTKRKLVDGIFRKVSVVIPDPRTDDL